MSWLSKVFALNPAGVSWARGVLFLDVALVPLVVFWAIGHEVYLLSALFGALSAVLADPGGGYGYRASRVAVFALIGAGVTALGLHAMAIRLWNYAVYCGAIAAAALILVDLPQPSNYGAEGDRVLWTLSGVGIAVIVMLLAGLLAKRAAKAPPHPARQPA
jgi:4-amino-4-deoxy-L-arabinose transferase-like glycosyltransferase